VLSFTVHLEWPDGADILQAVRAIQSEAAGNLNTFGDR
jgi:hypothetical protein